MFLCIPLSSQNYSSCLPISATRVCIKVPGDTWSKMHEFPRMFAIQNIQTLAHVIASKYYGLPVQIKEWIAVSLPLYPMGNFNFPQPLVPNMHEFVQFCLYCIHHVILHKRKKKKYDLPVHQKIPSVPWYLKQVSKLHLTCSLTNKSLRIIIRGSTKAQQTTC